MHSLITATFTRAHSVAASLAAVESTSPMPPSTQPSPSPPNLHLHRARLESAAGIASSPVRDPRYRRARRHPDLRRPHHHLAPHLPPSPPLPSPDRRRCPCRRRPRRHRPHHRGSRHNRARHYVVARVQISFISRGYLADLVAIMCAIMCAIMHNVCYYACYYAQCLIIAELLCTMSHNS